MMRRIRRCLHQAFGGKRGWVWPARKNATQPWIGTDSYGGDGAGLEGGNVLVSGQQRALGSMERMTWQHAVVIVPSSDRSQPAAEKWSGIYAHPPVAF